MNTQGLEPTERHAPLVAYEQLQRAHEQLRTRYATQSVQLEEASTQITALRAERDQLLAQNEGLQQQVTTLTQQLKEVRDMAFGSRSERMVPAAASAPDAEAPHDAATAAKRYLREAARKARSGTEKPRRTVRQFVSNIVPYEEIILKPEGDLSSLKEIGFVETVTVTYVPGYLKRMVTKRIKYLNPETGKIVIAALPPRLIPRGIPEAPLLAHLLITKFLEHQPTNRQRAKFSRAGITIPSSTLYSWIQQTAKALIPLHEALKEELLDSDYLQADETTIAVQDLEKKGKHHRGYFWVHQAPEKGLLVVDYRKGRGRAEEQAFLAGYQGALQTDGYVVYDVFDHEEAITTHGCWAHVRRKFINALASALEYSTYALEQIRLLYAIERRLRMQKATPEQRRQVRQAETEPLLRAFKAWLENHPGTPGSPWNQAVRYALNRWEKLYRYVMDGRVEMDNNLVENSIRPIAVGRRNYLAIGSHKAAQDAAIMYSLLGSCVQQGVNPQQWLTDVLKRLPTQAEHRIHELLPHHWKTLRPNEPP